MLPSLQEVANRNISSRVLMVALLGGTALTISQILHRKPEHVDTTVASTVENVETVATTDEKIGTQSQAQPRHVSTERAKRESRNGRETPTEQKRDASLAQEPRFLPQVAAAQAPRNAASVSEVPEKQPATTSGVQAIPVVLQIENGHISQASVLKHRAGMARYEAAALRIARQRRYPTAGKHTEIVVVKVTDPNPN